VLGVALNFTSIDPIKALFWSAVINGVIAVPFMAIVMLMAAKTDVMAQFVVTIRLRILGWLATVVMALAVLAMVITSLRACDFRCNVESKLNHSRWSEYLLV